MRSKKDGKGARQINIAWAGWDNSLKFKIERSKGEPLNERRLPVKRNLRSNGSLCTAHGGIGEVKSWKLDLFVLAGGGRRYQPWLTSIIDPFSGFIYGTCATVEKPDAMAVMKCLKEGIKQNTNELGLKLPNQLHIDDDYNGLDDLCRRQGITIIKKPPTRLAKFPKPGVIQKPQSQQEETL